MFEPFLNVYYLQNGLTETQIGWMAAVLPFCTMIINPLITRLADRAQRRVWFLTVTCLFFALAMLALAVYNKTLTFTVLLGLITLISIFRSPVNPLADSLVASMASRFRLDYGHMRLWGSIFFTISAISLGVVWQKTGFNTMFTVSGVCFFLVSLAAFFLDEPEAISLSPAAVTERQPFRIDLGLLFLIGGTFIILAALFMTITFGAVYVTRLGGGTALVGSLMGTAALGEVPGMLFGNRIARRIGDTNMLLIAYALVAAGLYGYTLSNEAWVLLSFALLRGIGFGALLVGTVTIINNRAPKNQAATYQGILSASCWGLAPLLGGPLSGWIYQSFGPMPFFITATGMGVLAGIILIPTYHYWKTR